jgi:hypothetical protein
LAGGSYFRTSAILDAFSDAAINDIDWDLAECYESKRLYSSDFAMPIVLAARGYRFVCTNLLPFKKGSCTLAPHASVWSDD